MILNTTNRSRKEPVSKDPSALPKKVRVRTWWREIILTSINIILIVSTFFYLAKLPERARIAKDSRNFMSIPNEKLNLDLTKFEIATASEKYEKLNMLFPDQKELLDFIGQVDKLKTEASVSYFSFASEAVVKEKSGYVGYPFVIEFQGTLTQISDGLERLSKLPYVFKPVNISIEKAEDNKSMLLRYGGFLYVDETTQKN